MGMAAKAGTETKKAAKKAPEKKAPAKRAAAKTTAPKKTTPEVFVSEEDCYLFGQGTHYDIYEKLGAHPSVKDGQKGYFFGVWAPNAGQVHVIGEFNGWNEEQNPMTKVGPVGIWTAFLPGVQEGQLYKFLITTPEGGKIYKADPYANWAELRPGTASRTADLSGYTWHDVRWMEDRAKKDPNKEPMAIYECHVGSWMKHPDGTEDGFYTYREFADRLVKYLKEMKFTHVELMGTLEQPFDGSWGYQVTGYYAPTSRYGSPKDFMYLVDTLHKAHVGVILDWVPAHFCPDAHGLAKFDGQCIYEDPDPRRGEHPDWGTKIFNLGKPEVKDFLIANVLYWIRDYHIDGIRVDAVASMLYLDYGKKDGQWLPNKYGGNKNLEAIEFFKHMNSVVRGSYPGFVTIAEESTAWPNVTSPIGSADGLGFSFKWNMGWMHDFCEYMKLDPVMRKGSHYNMTFAMSYNSAENYILPLSHDEVVHLKCSMLNKMPGYEVDKFANLRLGYTFMMGHAGKKLLFMGQEFAQEREWSEARELDWFLLQQPLHEGMRKYVAQLLKIYSKYPCMHEIDNDWAGFEWINANDKERSIYSFFRKCPDDKRRIMFILNMTPVEYPEYRLGVPELKTYRVILNSTDPEYGGAGSNVPKSLKAMKGDCDYKPQYITFDMPAYGGLVLEF